MPTDAASYHPNQGKNSALGLESAGAVGEKEPMPAVPSSGASDEGSQNYGAIASHAASHGRPHSGPNPDNVSGDVESAGATKAEGDPGVIDFPHAGPPPRTTSVGGGTDAA